jgi:hypothetical protein
MLCSKLISVNIPASVTFIGDATFRFCDNLTSISVDALNPVYYSIDGVLLDRNSQTLMVYPPQKTGSYSVPEGVKIIGIMAFCYCNGLTSVVLSSSVTRLSDGAFANCINLKSITLPASLQNIEYQAFYCCDNLTEIINFSKVPQDLSTSWLPSTAIAKCTLRVLSEAVGNYKLANVWGIFMEILPIEDKIALNYNEIYLLPGSTIKLDAGLTGGAANPKLIWWINSQSEVATVDAHGKLTANIPGTAVIIASIEEGEAECSVTVIEKGKMFIDMGGTKVERERLYNYFE